MLRAQLRRSSLNLPPDQSIPFARKLRSILRSTAGPKWLRRPWASGRALGPGPRGPSPSPPPPRTLSARCWTRFASFGVKPFFKATKRAHQVLSKQPNRADQVLQSNNMIHVLSTSTSRLNVLATYPPTLHLPITTYPTTAAAYIPQLSHPQLNPH